MLYYAGLDGIISNLIYVCSYIKIFLVLVSTFHLLRTIVKGDVVIYFKEKGRNSVAEHKPVLQKVLGSMPYISS